MQSGVGRKILILKHLPSGETPGQIRFAMYSLTTATGCAVALSVSASPRPNTIRVPIVRKNSGVTA